VIVTLKKRIRGLLGTGSWMKRTAEHMTTIQPTDFQLATDKEHVNGEWVTRTQPSVCVHVFTKSPTGTGGDKTAAQQKADAQECAAVRAQLAADAAGFSLSVTDCSARLAAYGAAQQAVRQMLAMQPTAQARAEEVEEAARLLRQEWPISVELTLLSGRPISHNLVFYKVTDAALAYTAGEPGAVPPAAPLPPEADRGSAAAAAAGEPCSLQLLLKPGLLAPRSDGSPVVCHPKALRPGDRVGVEGVLRLSLRPPHTPVISASRVVLLL
jgi:hypothetical protein